ncbi:hypothetical protein [Sphingomonas sp.]|uniref:hypothetical protein n=1 Tax=Sphingomonas sp. TaxID=28214 RepID=UPI0035A87F64
MTRIAAARPIEADTPNPRAVVGGNRPPIHELAGMDFNEAIDAHEGLRARITALVDSSSRAVATDDETAARCAELIRQMGAAEKVVDEERQAVKRPYLEAGRIIDDQAKSLVAALSNAKAKVRGITEDYMRAEQRRLDEERREREAEAERQRAERQRIIDEANQKAREEAEAERQRLQAIEDQRAAAEAREAVAVEVKPESVFVPEPEPVYAEPVAEPARVRSDLGAVASARKVKVATITDYTKAFKAVKNVSKVQEAVQTAINALVRAGQTEIPGVTITDDIGLSVR